jgi:photosystem II stability/assembly factor-like uncharacterized protein
VEHRPGTIPDDLTALRWRHVGPQGNRVSAVVCDSNDLNIYYAGACAGGVWKSSDGGTNWEPVFDDQTAQSIGALAIAPSDSNQLWAGTGEAFIRSNVLVGNGIYKSMDAGRTWALMGLEKSGRIGRIIVHPRDPNIVFAACLGHCYGPQKERGVYRTKDGGKTWEQVLFADENTGCSGLAMDPNNPRILFAGMWSIVIHTWGKFSGGPGSGVFVSRDGGDTWTRIKGRGLPEFEVGKIDVAVAPTNSNRVYALIETGDNGSLWRSDDGGFNWRIVSYERRINERPHYYTRMCIAPDDENTVYFPCNSMYVTYDGGDSIENFSGGGDCHDMWADPKNPKRMMIGNDGGVNLTTTRGRQWRNVKLPIGQMYHVAVDNRVPYFVYSNMQDSTSKRGPAYPGFGSEPPIWIGMGGCESGFSYPDPVNTDIVWGTCYAGTVEIYNLRTGLVRNVNPWPEKSFDSPAGVIKYRWNWTHSIVLSPHDHNKVYVGSQYVHMSTNGGQSWTIISPDLTTNDKSKLGSSGGLSKDNLGVEYGCTLFAIAESPVEAGVIWVGSNDGLVHITRDGGKNWTNVTPPGMPLWGTVSMIDPSRFEAGRCYIAVDGHQENVRDPYLFKTVDYGKTWARIDATIPRTVLSYTSAIKEDPVRKGLLYAGTANAIYVSFDDGGTWHLLQANLPQACITWIAVQEHFNDLVVGTNGRGVWIMDDITPLRQITPDVRNAAATLLKPRLAYRFKSREGIDNVPNDQSRGQSAPYGAAISYYLKEAAKSGIMVEILDETGQKVRTLRGTGNKGLNRVEWNLRHEPLQQIELRTTPSFHPHVWEEKRFRGRETRPVLHWGIQQPQAGVLAAPGMYTVKLTAEGKEFTEKLEVRKDPNSQGTLEDIMEMVRLWTAVVQDINEVVGMINRIEWVGKQMEDLGKVLGRVKDGKPVQDAFADIQKKVMTVEDKLLQRQLHASDPKSYRAEMMLYSKLLWFSGEIGTGAGDIRNTEDFGPTSQQLEVYEILKKRLAEVRAEYDKLFKEDIPAFNNKLKEAGLGSLITNLDVRSAPPDESVFRRR